MSFASYHSTSRSHILLYPAIAYSCIDIRREEERDLNHLIIRPKKYDLTSTYSLFFGKTKVMAVALGQTPESEAATNLHKLAPYLTGAVGLLFTSRDPQSVIEYFENFRPLDFARAGTVSTRSFSLPNGLVYSRGGDLPADQDEPVSHTIEPELRKLGVPTRLVKGKVMLELTEGQESFPICREGEVLDSRQTTLLKMFGVVSSEFHVALKAHWNRDAGEVKILEKAAGGMEVDGQ